MELLEADEAFKLVQGKPEFSYVKGIVRHKGDFYFGKWRDRRQAPSSFSQLYDVKRLETDARGPEVNPSWTMAAEQIDFVKKPNLFDYATAPDLEMRLRREVETCELLRRRPHRHIASYYGAQALRGRVSGLCFRSYSSTLSERVNPGHLNKAAFILSGRPLVEDGMMAQLDGIASGARHLHSLGLVHNDITPANIMLEEDGTWVIINFDSCRHAGEALRDTDTKRTHGWHDPDVTVASEKNDIDAIAELRTWLFGSSADGLLFR